MTDDGVGRLLVVSLHQSIGEALPQQIWSEAHRVCSELDCLLVVGTSATVYPAAGLIELAAAAGAKIISINTEPSGSFGWEHIELVGAAASVLPSLLDGLTLESSR